VVENGNVKLYGVVDSAMDKQIAEMRAREVGGVFSVESPVGSQSVNRGSSSNFRQSV
jgi:osmotically-inducible protein OsmY